MVWMHIYNGVVIISIGTSISSIKGKVASLMRRVCKSLECIPRGFRAWGVELAMFGRHFAWWDKHNHVKTLISQRISTKSMYSSPKIQRKTYMSTANPNLVEKSMVSLLVVANAVGGSPLVKSRENSDFAMDINEINVELS
jgi:hypothetical protein